MKALIDSDYFAYAHGNATDDEGHPLSWPLVASRINQQIENIIRSSGSNDYKLYLTGSGNFREGVATIRPYKGNRPTDKPFHYERIREYLIKFRNATLVDGMEADDAVGIEQYRSYSTIRDWVYPRRKDWRDVQRACIDGWFKVPEEIRQEGTIICSIDKDLDMIPGWHYNWQRDERYWIDETTALRNFYCQLLTGDITDNIPGLYGVGKSSKLLSDVRKLNDELSMYNLVMAQYEKRFGSYWWQFLLENAQLLWILRNKVHTDNGNEESPEFEIETRLQCLEDQRQLREEAA